MLRTESVATRSGIVGPCVRDRRAGLAEGAFSGVGARLVRLVGVAVSTDLSRSRGARRRRLVATGRAGGPGRRMRRVRRRGAESPGVPIEARARLPHGRCRLAAHGGAAAVAAVLIGPWMLSLATNAVGEHGVLIAIGPCTFDQGLPVRHAYGGGYRAVLGVPLAGAPGLPPLDRTPVYAACWLCQNSSNSLGDM